MFLTNLPFIRTVCKVDLIDNMLVVDPKARYTIDECLDHIWTKADDMLNVNDSTGLIGGLRGLNVGRRGVARERTLLARLNSIHEERISDGRRTIGVFSKGKNRVTNAPTPQPRPADGRTAANFMDMGGVGDPQLLPNEDGIVYAQGDIADKKTRKYGKGRR